MNFLKKIIYFSFIAFALFTISACSNLNPPKPEASCTANLNKQYLFVIHSTHGQLTRHADGQMYLTLKNPTTYAFTDRPYRQTHHVPTQQFLNLWQQKLNDGFTKDHPNAALAGIHLEINSASLSTAAKELNDLVVLDAATVDQTSGDLVFKLQDLIAGQTLKPSQFSDASLFIDDGISLYNF